MLNRVVEISKLTIRLLIGVFFVVAAVSKLISIDNFEVYIYSFNIFSFVTTTFFSRLLIFIELSLGLSLIFKIRYKQTWWLAVSMMAVFIVFLIFAIIFRDDSNCHCLGSLIELNPRQSILKNIITLALLFLIKKEDNFEIKTLSNPRSKRWLTAVILIISAVISFVIMPMDIIYNKIYSEENNINTNAFYESLNDSTYFSFLRVLPEKADDSIIFVREIQPMDVSDGRYIINYALAGCKYCSVGAEKLSLMLDKHDVSHEKVKFVVGGSDIAVSNFIRHTNTFDYEHWKITASKFMSVTYGKFPLYVFVEDGKIVKAGDFRNIEERDLVEFLK